MNISAVFGLIGSGLLAIPAIRQEKRRSRYSNFLRSRRDPNEDIDLARAVEWSQIRDYLVWSPLDSAFVLIGVSLIILSFLLEIFMSP